MGGTDTATPSLLSLLASASSLIDLLPHLHQHALDVTAGCCSLLFEHNPRNGALQATSGYALEELRIDPWLPGPDEAALVAQTFARREATFVTDLDRQMPDLAARLGTPSARLLPLVYGDDRIGLLAIGFRGGARRHDPRGRLLGGLRRVRHGARIVPPAPPRHAAAGSA